MQKVIWLCLFISLALLVALSDSPAQGKKKKDKGDDTAWTKDFFVEKGELVSTGKNPFLILEPGYQLILEGGGERLVKTVLHETKMVDGVETRIVEEHESKDGKLVEISRNYFAISKRTNSV